MTYAFVGSINRIVKTKQPRLRTQSGQVPYLENACCDDKPGCEKVVNYFGSMDASIYKWMTLCRELDQRLQGVSDTLMSPFLFYSLRPVFPVDVEMKGTPVFNMKLALVHYLFDLRYYDRPALMSIIKVAAPTEAYYRCVTKMDKIAYLEHENPDWNTPNAATFAKFMQQISLDHRVEIPEYVTWEKSWVIRLGHYSDAAQVMQETEQGDTQVLEAIANLQKSHSQDTVETIATVTTSQNLFSVKRRRMEDDLLRHYSLDIRKTTTVDKWLKTVDVTTKHQYYRNSVYCLLHMYPQTVLGAGITLKWKTPEHWVFSDTHNKMLQDRVNEYAESFAGFKGDTLLQGVLTTFQRKTEHYGEWFESLPVSSIDDGALTYLYAYVVADIYSQYFDALTEVLQEVTVDEVKEREEELLNVFRQDIGDDEMVEALMKERENIMDESLGEQLKKQTVQDHEARLSSYLNVCMQHEIVRLQQVNIDYSLVIDETLRHADREKTAMIEHFDKMTPEGKRVEMLMKKFKLGRWNVGKEVFSYKKNNFDIEITSANYTGMEEGIKDEVELGETDEIEAIDDDGYNVQENYEEEEESHYLDDLEENYDE